MHPFNLFFICLIFSPELHSRTMDQPDETDGALNDYDDGGSMPADNLNETETEESLEAKHKAMSNPDLLGGDMLGLKPGTLFPKNHVAGQLWPGGVVHYVIDRSLGRFTRRIQAAFEEYHRKTCIRFRPRTFQRAFVHIKHGWGCNSQVGRRGNAQPLNLQIGSCLSHGTILHELGHAIGFMHTQMRPDRDRYVALICANIKQGTESQFVKSGGRILVPYDTSSIMHYHSWSFSKNRNPTIIKLDGKFIRDANHLSQLDVRAIRRLYRC